jgi:hypothetical protein
MRILPKETVVTVKIKSPGINLELKNVSYDVAINAVKGIREGSTDTKLNEMIDYSLPSFGFVGQSHGDYVVNIDARLPRTSTGEKQTCGRRMNDFGPWERKENLDEWEIIGKDKICSFCGSLHPESVLEIVKEFGKETIEIAKSYKWYVKRPDVPNASFGGIKYYRDHDTPEFLEELKELIK